MVMSSAAMMVMVAVVATVVGGSSLVPRPRLDTLDCGDTTMKPGERVVVQSPNFPQNYDVNYRCQYEITCEPMKSTYLEYRCPVFELESSPGCSADRLVVASHGSREVKCGTDSPDGTITSDGLDTSYILQQWQHRRQGLPLLYLVP
ncbi:tumor necrosis factor-inducible gene 6 protein-like [Panulirus ornatus]|uniref:tumor necrosis factor-inducible gene 6 protein-like n=1 Tax=Panulirus ornatus TaxID=150431 RepID=UPI003A8C7120